MRRSRTTNTLLTVAATLGLALLGTTSATAQFWNGNVDNDWHTGANWDGGVVPTFGDNAAIASDVNTNTIAEITTANADSDGMFVGLRVNGTVVDGTVNHSAFTGTFTNGMVIGRGDATGTYNQSGLTTDPNGPSIVNTGFVAVGTDDSTLLTGITSGTGFYNLSGDAQLNASSFVIMGELVGIDNTSASFVSSVGTMTLNDNAILNANFDNGGLGDVSLIVGRQGTGGISPSPPFEGKLEVHDNATVNAKDRIHVGDFFGAKGVVEQDGNSVVNSKTLWLGVFDAGGEGTEGTYNISGTATLNTDNLIVGRDGGKGTLNISESADFNVNGATAIGDTNGGNGVVNQSGGTVDTTAWIGIGNATGTTGEYNLSGGSVHTDADFKVGDNGNGTMNQDGGSVSSGTWLAVGAQAGSTGTYNLNAGTVTVGTNAAEDLNVGDGGTGIMTQAAGTTITVSRDFNIGKNAGSVGTYTQNGGDITARAWMTVGRNVGSGGGAVQGAQGTYNMNGGSIAVNGRLVIGSEGSATELPSKGTFNLNDGIINVQNNGVGQEGVLVVGRTGDGTMNQSGGAITSQWVDVGGDPGVGDNVNGGEYNMTGGSITTTDPTVGIRIGVGVDPGSGSEFNIDATVNSPTINSAGGLEIGRDGDASLRVVGSQATLQFGGDLSMSTGTAIGALAFGSDASGVSAIQIGGDADVSDGLLQALLTTDTFGVGLPTSPITTPHDLLLVDNQGNTWVEGLLNFDNNFDGVGDQLLEQGEALTDPLGVLGGNTYFISYFGLTGTDNDIYLTLNPIAAVDNADFDADGDRDGKDFLTWQRGFGNGISRPEGDADANGGVGGVDLDIWESQAGLPSVPPIAAAASVPEPTSMALLGPAALLLCQGRRRRSRSARVSDPAAVPTVGLLK